MRIRTVDIPAENAFGLKALKMERLGEVVVIAGKNGSGKTRLLDRLHAWKAEQAWPHQNLEVLKREVIRSRRYWSRESLAEYYETTFPSEKHIWKNTLNQFYDIEFEGSGIPSIVKFIPKDVALQNHSSMSRQDILNNANNLEELGVGHLRTGTLAKIQLLQDRWWSATHQHSTAGGTEKENAISQYENLVALISKFLKTVLRRNLNDEATLFGFPLGEAKLSHGQIILLQLCVALHTQADRLSDLILLLDEPENHLHPEAMLDAVEQILSVLTQGQVWIASHSIPLLARFNPDQIWWMESGMLQHAGSTPERVLKSLLGDEERVARLGDFLGVPAAYAAVNFAFQCLGSPEVLMTDAADPQTSQIQRILASKSTGKALRLLDYGAGRGRLLSAIHSAYTGERNLAESIDYRAFDVIGTHRAECEAAIGRSYADGTKRAYFSQEELYSDLDEKTCDVVVMCNVLHEIDVVEWPDNFSHGGPLLHSMKTEGALLIVEDTEMRVGEGPHQRGFLVLSTPGIRALFDIKENEPGYACSLLQEGRLQAHLIPAACVKRMTLESLIKALQITQRLAVEDIKNLRKLDPSYRAGRRHAFQVHLLANTHLALRVLGVPNTE